MRVFIVQGPAGGSQAAGRFSGQTGTKVTVYLRTIGAGCNSMLKNNIEIDFKVKCIEESTTQAKIAETVGTSPQYVSRLINNQENIVNKTFLSMMEALGYDVELTYVRKED